MTELDKALEITGSAPSDDQIKNAAEKWKKALDSPYRLYADKDFMAGSIWGMKVMRAYKNKRVIHLFNVATCPNVKNGCNNIGTILKWNNEYERFDQES